MVVYNKFWKYIHFQVCEKENRILRIAVGKLATTNNSTIGDKYFDDSCSTDEDCPNGHGFCDESGTCQSKYVMPIGTAMGSANLGYSSCRQFIMYRKGGGIGLKSLNGFKFKSTS